MSVRLSAGNYGTRALGATCRSGKLGAVAVDTALACVRRPLLPLQTAARGPAVIGPAIAPRRSTAAIGGSAGRSESVARRLLAGSTRA